MGYIIESLRQLYGVEPARTPKEEIAPAVQVVHFHKKQHPYSKKKLEADNVVCGARSTKWRNRRWITLILVNLLFVVSYYFDIQLLEGAMTASRFVGFHMADLNSALQVMLAFKHVVLNLLIGTATIFVLWLLLGGRTFCSWVCPYHLLSEWAEKLHLWLVGKKLIKNHTFNRRVRSLFYLLFTLLALLTGYTVFETISPTGILSRALIYGPSIALVWVSALLLFEVLYSRRAWCRYICPIGITYGIVGILSPLRIKYDVRDCDHEGDCRRVCLVPHVLDNAIKGRATNLEVDISADCTRCGMCVDVCTTNSLKFEIKGLGKYL